MRINKLGFPTVVGEDAMALRLHFLRASFGVSLCPAVAGQDSGIMPVRVDFLFFESLCGPSSVPGPIF